MLLSLFGQQIDQNLCLGWPGQDCTETYVVQKDE